ncbi:UDP-glucose 4-epimerase GalE [Nocardioides sp. 503]|uniref:UDP-glucose 4-epimerase GalE n=1 Tax=Nocardioides sp. 503 TaxID=2508326 RepID=UPI00106FAA11|nr:UDP-glucose 4-epimerase GalE [Nocardioides sp. 503]
MTWLITGGAGYIGSHVVRALRQDGRPVVVLDDLSTGRLEFVPEGVPVVEESLLDADLRSVLSDHDVRGVVHLAAFKYAGVSVERPLHTYEQNVTALTRLLSAMVDRGVDKLVYSSSAAVFGAPDVELVTESTPTGPSTPYGRSKLVGEQMLADVGRAHGLTHTSLRYFNVVGSGTPLVRDVSPHNLLPATLERVARGEAPQIMGHDFPTDDGTAVRDYVHVSDVARAHASAVRRMEERQPCEPVYHLGSRTGTSVLEAMRTVREVTGTALEPRLLPRRPGDPARIVADSELAARDLEWQVRHSFRDMVQSAWDALPS